MCISLCDTSTCCVVAWQYPYCSGKISIPATQSTIMRVTTVNIPIERLEQLFYAFDLDMDGYIDQSELHTLIHKSYAMFEHTLSLQSWSSLVIQLSIQCSPGVIYMSKRGCLSNSGQSGFTETCNKVFQKDIMTNHAGNNNDQYTWCFYPQ